MTRLWVDDQRDAPDDTWVVAKTYADAVRILGDSPMDRVSLDHDLAAYEEESGLDIAVWMAENLTDWPRVIAIHTANLIGGEEMYAVLRKAAPAKTHVFIDDRFQGEPTF